MMRDIFGSLLFLSLQKKVDMAEVLRYPLTPLALSLCYTDDRMQSTPKSALLNEIEARVTCVLPEYIDVILVDGMFFLHSLIDLPNTMGQTATVILKKMCSSYNSDIFILFSIKWSHLQSRTWNTSHEVL